jgi:RNase H-like domain found in reverse transcriptase
MLSIVETLKEFQTLLLECRMQIYTDHENLIRRTTVSKYSHIQQWQWTIKYLDIDYIKGPQCGS